MTVSESFFVMTIKLTNKQIKSFQKEILDWYEKNKRDLPWRVSDSTRVQQRDPYKILVSEVMSQQTQISRVVPMYIEWMKRFPTVQSLAEAPTSEVLRYWSGLGYNRRALYVQKLARELVERSSSRGVSTTKQSHKKEGDRHASLAMTILWPATEEELRKLPGVGEYTARAILCFAFNKQVAVVDTNVRKVILTLFKGPKGTEEPKETKENEIREIAQQVLPKGRAYEWNQALMDYASVMLKEHKIPIPKQSKFKDSDRYYRGGILKVLLKERAIAIDGLLDYFSQQQAPVTKERLQTIVERMEKESLLQKRGNTILLPGE